MPTIPSSVTERDGRITLANERVRLDFDLQDHGALVSIVDLATGTELIRDAEALRLLWRLGLRRAGDTEVEMLTSAEAGSLQRRVHQGEGGVTLELTSSGLPEHALEVSVQVTLADDSPLTSWRMAVRGLAEGVAATQLACPILAGLVKLGDPAPGETLLAPVQGEAYLYRDPYPVRDGLPLCAGPGPEEADVGVGSVGGRYPGAIALQMMALYNDRAGLYFAAHDAGQYPKDLHMGPWPTLGQGPVLSMTHLLTERPGEEVVVSYDTLVAVFHGDWYDAADIYKDWGRQQWWCERKLWDRDLADWLRQGVGGVWQMSNFHMPRLDLNHSVGLIADTVNEVAEDAGVPLLSLIFNWEQGGPWTGPKGFFPPREGEAAFREAMVKLRQAGNFGFVYMTGNTWYVKLAYDPVWDSWEQFYAQGEALALRRPDGEYTVMDWFGGWEIVRLCPEPAAALEIHADVLLGCLDLGCTVVQIDNIPCGGSEACYDPTHGHPLGHGSWWSEACTRNLAELRRRAKAAHPECAMTTEGIAENFMPWLDMYDQRAGNMEYFGHYWRGMPMGGETVPLFNYVYNEYIGSYYAAFPECNRPEVLYWTRGLGKALCQGVLPSAGRYFPDPPDSNPVTLAFYQRIVRTTGRELYPYLMFGEMLRPPKIEVPTFTAQYCKFLYDGANFKHHMDPQQRHEVIDRTVQHAAYRGRDGSACLLFVNVSDQAVEFPVEMPAYEFTATVQVQQITNGEAEEWPADVALPQKVALEMEPFSITLLILREPTR
jgi:hypothetical protein